MDMHDIKYLVRPDVNKIEAAVKRAFTRDSMMTFDQATVDSAGAFFIGQLERLDPTLNLPLVDYQWSRDIEVRADVGLGDELASFTLSSFASAGGLAPNGISWIGKDVNTIQSMALDIGKTSQPLYAWGMTVSATIPELTSAQQTGHDIIGEKYDAMQLKLNMDTDQLVYIGDSTLGTYGLLNHASVTNNTNAVTGAWAGGATTPQQILADVNEAIESPWKASGYARCPNRLLLPPFQYAYIASTIISISGTAGGMSILEFLERNSISLRINGSPLQILPSKWLTGTTAGGLGPGAAGKDRMVAYTNDQKYVRYPKTDVVPGPMEYRSLSQHVPYWGRLGVVEMRYPETVAYRDGI